MILNNHFTPIWEVIENFRHYLSKIKKQKISDLQISKELGINRATLAQHKHDNSSSFLSYLSIYCIKNNIDIRQFCKFNICVILKSN